MIYELNTIGGPKDGLMSYSPRPYEILHHSDDDSVYAAREPAPDCLRWLKDEEYAIDLHHVGYGQKLFDRLSGERAK